MALLMAVLLLTLSPAAFAQDSTPPVEPPTPIRSDTPVPPTNTHTPLPTLTPIPFSTPTPSMTATASATATYTPTVGRTQSPTVSAAPLVLATATLNPDYNLIANFNFNSGLANWSFNGSTQQITNGALLIAPTAPAGGFSQTIPYSSGGEIFEVSFEASNYSTTSKTVNVIVRDTNWTAQYNCVFTLPASLPLRFYRMKFDTTQNFTPMIFQVALSGDSTLGVAFDNIVMSRKTNITVSGTECTVGPPPYTELIYDGGFNQGTAQWASFNADMRVVNIGGVNGNIMEIARNANTPNGGFYQFNPYSVPANSVLELRFEIGNQSNVARVINMLVRDPNWQDVHSCFITVPANSGLWYPAIFLTTNVAWSNIVVQGWIQIGDYTGSGTRPFRFDNISLIYLPSSTYTGSTTCPPPFPTTPSPTPTRTPTYTPTPTRTNTRTLTLTPTPTGGTCPMPERGNIALTGMPNALCQVNTPTFTPTPTASAIPQVYHVSCALQNPANVRNFPAGDPIIPQIDGRVLFTLPQGTLVNVYELRPARDNVMWARISDYEDPNVNGRDTLWIRTTDNFNTILVSGNPSCTPLTANLQQPTFIPPTPSYPIASPGCLAGRDCTHQLPGISDADLVSWMIACEAGAAAGIPAPGSVEDAIANAHVIYNRMESLTYAGTARQVVTQAYQWSPWMEGCNSSLNLQSLGEIDPLIQDAAEAITSNPPVEPVAPLNPLIDYLALYTFGVPNPNHPNSPPPVATMLAPYCPQGTAQAMQVYLAIASFGNGARPNASVFFSDGPGCNL
jgi:hypothetical protein